VTRLVARSFIVPIL